MRCCSAPSLTVFAAMRLAKHAYAGDVTVLHYATLRSQQGGGEKRQLLLLGEHSSMLCTNPHHPR